VPDGYFVLRSRTCGNLMFFRGFIVNGDLRPAVESAKQNFRIYPLARAANPPAMTFVDISGKYFNTIHAIDATFFEEVAHVVQEEPLDAIDPETRGLLAAIGIRKDKPFAPDARTFYYYVGTGSSPAWVKKMVGAGSQHACAERDATGKYLDGAKSCRLHLPPNIPAKNFWSLVVYDPQTRSMLQTDQQFPSAGSQKDGITVNPDGSVDVYFGPEATPGRETNWIQTVPGKGWFVALRLYGPLDSWFDKTWRPGEIEPVR
jgi:hypothetical protein